MWLTWISTVKIFLNSVNTARLEDFIKCQSLHTTGLTIALWSVLRLFLFFSWNYTRNYTRNYVSPAAIFKKPQVHDPETLTADKKLLRAAVLLTSHLSHTPSALEAIPSSSPPSVSPYDGACAPQAPPRGSACCWVTHQTACVDSFSGSQAAGSQSVSLTEVYLLTFFYNEGSLGRNVDAFRHEGILCMCPERSIWCCGRPLRLITTSEVGGIPWFDAFQDFVLCTMSSEDYQPWILLPPFKRPLRTHKFSASELKHRIYMCLLFSYPLILPG